jgi:hypothetical protein
MMLSCPFYPHEEIPWILRVLSIDFTTQDFKRGVINHGTTRGSIFQELVDILRIYCCLLDINRCSHLTLDYPLK